MSWAHQSRVVAAAASLESATAAFVAYLEALPDPVPIQPLPGGWTAAGHAAHLGLTNEVFVGVINGGGPLSAFAGASDFSDEKWDLDAPPIGVAAPPILIPPPHIGRVVAIAELRHSVRRLRSAILSMDPHLATMCVRLPWAVVSLYQMSEWGAGHTVRHLSQVSRELQVAAMRDEPVSP
jgi:hypothetical protein